MAMTAVAVRHANLEDGNEFQNWVSSLMGDGPAAQGRMMDPDAMASKMPEIPVAGADD